MPFSKEDVAQACQASIPEMLHPDSVSETRPGTWAANCWLHEDDRKSIAIWRFNDGMFRFRCYGCGAKGTAIDAYMGIHTVNFPKAVEALIGRPSEYKPKTEELGKEVATYDYLDAGGKLLYQIRRYEPKNFRPWHKAPTGLDTYEWRMGYGTKERVLYGSDRWSTATGIYLVEGEKDVDSLTKAGCIAVTWAGGADSWRDRYADTLKGVDEVVLIPDNDKPGRACMRQASLALMDRGIKVGYILLENAKDISEWLDFGLPMSDLEGDIVWDQPVPPFEVSK